MPRRRFYLILACGFLAGLLGLPGYAGGRPALAAPQPAACDQPATYLDLDGDGADDAVKALVHFSPAPQDAVTVIAAGGLQAMPCWRDAVRAEGETWIFDAGNTGRASLIMVFRREPDGLTATLYDDQDGDARVAYAFSGAQLDVIESKHWTIRVVAPDGWWTKGAQVNYNLRLQVDGKLEGAFGALDRLNRLLINDGRIDFEIQTYDPSGIGRPQFEYRFITPSPASRGMAGFNTHIMADWRGTDVAPGRGALWPYLGFGAYDSGDHVLRRRGEPATAPILVDWQRSRVIAVHEMVSSRANDGNCFYYSAVQPLPDTPSDLNFENPFCFYNLASAGRQAALIIRNQYWLPKDPLFLGKQFAFPFSQIRYSWDQNADGLLDYGLGLVGRVAIDTSVHMPGLEVRTVPYEQLPGWVASHTWDSGVFVAAERPYLSSEGIYETDLPPGVAQTYLAGRTDTPPFQDWAAYVKALAIANVTGLRLERNLTLSQRPVLFFSPVDRKLHLRGLRDGMWFINPHEAVAYESLGADGFINQWTYLIDGQPQRQLFAATGLLLYTDSGQLQIVRADTASLFEAEPPGDSQSWSQLRARLVSEQRGFAPGDFAAMLAQFGPPGSTLIGVSAHDVRLDGNGLRFTLELAPGFEVRGEDWIGLRGYAAGRYVVRYDGAFHLQPATPPALRLSAEPAGDPAVAYVPGEIKLAIQNQGLEDARTVVVTAQLTQPDTQLQATSIQTTTLLAGQTLAVRLPWTPPGAGEWQVQISGRVLDEGKPATEAALSQAVVVQPAQETTLAETAGAFALIPPGLQPALLGLVALLGALAGWTLLRITPSIEDQTKGG